MEKDGISLGVQLNLENHHSELWPCFSFSGHRLESYIFWFHAITGVNSLNPNTNISFSFNKSRHGSINSMRQGAEVWGDLCPLIDLGPYHLACLCNLGVECMLTIQHPCSPLLFWPYI